MKNRLFTLLHKFFFLLGLATFSTTQCSVFPKFKIDSKPIQKFIFQRSKFAVIYTIFLAIFDLSLSSYAAYGSYVNFYNRQLSFYPFLDVTINSLGVFMSVLIHLTYCVKSDKAIALLNRFLELHEKLRYFWPERDFFIISKFVISIFLFVTAICVPDLILYWKTWPNCLLVFMNFFPNFVVIWFVSQYAIMGKILLIMFKNVNEALESMGNDSSKLDPISDLVKKQNLRAIRSLYSELYKLSVELSSFYNLPILCSICYMFVVVVGNTYFFVVSFIDKKSLKDYNVSSEMTIPLFFLVILAIFCILTLTRTITEICCEVRKIIIVLFIKRKITNKIDIPYSQNRRSTLSMNCQQKITTLRFKKR